MRDFLTEDKVMDVRSDLEILDNLADWMDSKFRIPGTSIRFGLDSIIGFIPGIGDTIGLAVSGYVINIAHKYQQSNSTREAKFLRIPIRPSQRVSLLPISI